MAHMTANTKYRSSTGTYLNTAKSILAAAGLALLATNSPAADEHEEIKSTPVRYETYLEFLGTGKFLSVDGGIFRDGLIEGDGMHWQREIMKRSDAEIEAQRLEAIRFFESRYGIQIEGNEDIYFTGFEVDPRSHLRVYTFIDREVPPEGWEMRIGGWGFFVFAPDGITLGGEFEGLHVPRGAGALFGDYNILTDTGEEILISYAMSQPLMLNQFGGAVLEFDIYSEEFGAGVSEGSRFTTVPDPGSPLLIQQDVKVVFSFPADGIIGDSDRDGESRD